MSHYVHIHVVIPCDDNDDLAAVAKKFLPTINAKDEDCGREAAWFLEDLSTRTGKNPGRNGGLSLWGMIGNYTLVDEFCRLLLPFWTALLSEDTKGGPTEFDHIVVFEEQEQTEAANAYVIRWDDWESEVRQVEIVKHERLPFSFGT